KLFKKSFNQVFNALIGTFSSNINSPTIKTDKTG
ncbi:hypothetical protein NT05LM_3417, partial [Listeria marthii FSL S4-120]